jgi:hypothetical protein
MMRFFLTVPWPFVTMQTIYAIRSLEDRLDPTARSIESGVREGKGLVLCGSHQGIAAGARTGRYLE